MVVQLDGMQIEYEMPTDADLEELGFKRDGDFYSTSISKQCEIS